MARMWCSLVLGGGVLLLFWRLLRAKRSKRIGVWRNPFLKGRSGDPVAPVPSRFILFALGTRGDVQPMLTVARELLDRGHLVVICAAESFQELVESYGVRFASCGLATLDDQEEGWLKAQTEAEFLSVVANTYLPLYGKVGRALYDLCLEFKADMVVTGIYNLHMALDVAEKTGVKVRCVKYMPEGMSKYMAPFGVVPRWRHPYYILWLHIARLFRMFLAAHRYGFTKIQNQFRTKELGIGKVTAERIESGGKYLPTAFVYSTTLAPRPKDWAPWHVTIGFLFSNALNPAIPHDLERFLSNGPAPVVVTFGSMRSLRSAGCELIERSVSACLKLGLRVILISSDPLKNEAELSSDRFIKVKQVPHEVIFPRCALVIHHGGAGTTARVAQSGATQVIVPILKWLDQKGWGLAIEQFGSGLMLPSPFASEEEISHSVSTILQNPVKSLVFKARAKDLQRRMNKEPNAAKSFVDWLLSPIDNYEVDLDTYKKEALDRMAMRSCLYS